MKLHENEKYSTCLINDCFHIAFGSNCSGSWLQFMKTLCLCILASYHASQPGAIIQKEPPSSGVKFTILFFQSHLCPGKICVPSSALSFEVFLFILLEITSFVLTCTSCWQSCVITYSCLAQCIQDTLSVDSASQLLMHWQLW